MFFSIVLNGSTAFFKTARACRALSVFFALSVRACFSQRRELKNVQLWINHTQAIKHLSGSSLSLELANQSECRREWYYG